MGEDKIRLIIADDSAIIRGLLEKLFTSEPDFTVTASVSNGRKALDAAMSGNGDIIISDIDMPEMTGIELIKNLRGSNVPVTIFSEDVGFRHSALEAGAKLFELKPKLAAYRADKLQPFVQKIREIASTACSRKRNGGSENTSFSTYKVVVLGASTGGPSAVQQVLSSLGTHFSLPIVYVQHIDSGSDQTMVSWFSSSCPNIPIHLARDGEIAKPGHVYMAPADTHLLIDHISSDGMPVLKLSDEPEERFLRPAVNKLFRSAAKLYRNACLAVLLTGMGRDGAEGCQMIVENGGHTIVEDESTCAVFGMPAAAIELNAADEVIPLGKIATRLKVLTAGI